MARGYHCWRDCVTPSGADGHQPFFSQCLWSPERWQSLEQSCLDSHWWQQEWFWFLYFGFLQRYWIACPWSFFGSSSKVSVSLRWSLVSWSIFGPMINVLMMPLEIPGCDTSFLKVLFLIFWSWKNHFQRRHDFFQANFALKLLNFISIQLYTSSLSLGSLRMTLFSTLFGRPGVEMMILVSVKSTFPEK